MRTSLVRLLVPSVLALLLLVGVVLLGRWARERKALSLEDGVWRLTGHPVRAFRIRDRGLLREGYFADLVAFDPATIGAGTLERVYDQPGGADRLVARSGLLAGAGVPSSLRMGVRNALRQKQIGIALLDSKVPWHHSDHLVRNEIDH